jgi:hypothetical protein
MPNNLSVSKNNKKVVDFLYARGKVCIVMRGL